MPRTLNLWLCKPCIILVWSRLIDLQYLVFAAAAMGMMGQRGQRSHEVIPITRNKMWTILPALCRGWRRWSQTDVFLSKCVSNPTPESRISGPHAHYTGMYVDFSDTESYCIEACVMCGSFSRDQFLPDQLLFCTGAQSGRQQWGFYGHARNSRRRLQQKGKPTRAHGERPSSLVGTGVIKSRNQISYTYFLFSSFLVTRSPHTCSCRPRLSLSSPFFFISFGVVRMTTSSRDLPNQSYNSCGPRRWRSTP